MQTSSNQKNIFTNEQVESLAVFFGVLEKINRRLLCQDFTMINGILTPAESKSDKSFDPNNLIS